MGYSMRCIYGVCILLLSATAFAEVKEFVITDKLPPVQQLVQPDKPQPHEGGQKQGSVWSGFTTETVVDSREGYPLRTAAYTHPKFKSIAEFVAHLRQGVHRVRLAGYAVEQYTWAELESIHSDDHEGRLKPAVQVGVSRSVSTAAMADVLGVTWDEAAVNSINAGVQAVGAPYVVTVYVSGPDAHCPACEILKRNLGPGDSSVKINYVTSTAPAWLNTRGSVPFLYCEATKRIGWGSGYKTVQQVRDAFNIPSATTQDLVVGGVTAGSIDRITVDMLLKFFRPRKGSYTGGNDEMRFTGYVTLIIPADMQAAWSTVGDVTTLRFSGRKPSARWGLIDQQVDGISIQKDQVSLILPRMLDINLTVK